MLAKAWKAVRIGASSRLWRAARHGVAATVKHDRALRRFRFATVVDVGANKGQFAAFALARWPNAVIISFEPLDDARATLRRVLGPGHQIHACAIGAADGSAELHVASRADSSSLLPLGPEQRRIFGMREVAIRTVQVRRLDSCLLGPVRRPALLKIDVQGYEHEVLVGAARVLAGIDAVYVEASEIELYERQALHDRVAGELSRSGFRLRGSFNRRYHDGRPVQADHLYVREGRPLEA